MKLLKRFDILLNKLEGGLLILFLSAMILLAFAQVVLRNVFFAGILWGDILLRHLVLWIGFLGAAIATSNGRHISIDALTRFLPTRPRQAVSVLTHLFAAAICYLLLRGSITFIRNEIAMQTTVYESIPSWYGEIIIPVGFGLLVVHFVIRAVVGLQSFVRGEGPA
jgi:TRAP-type C4-dicarboxylate transport system permease small subunit